MRFAHDRQEYPNRLASGQYAWVVEQFAKRGLAVYAADLRGNGRGAGIRAEGRGPSALRRSVL
jgi:alpha-beta hydrolase superfamily lysophospholipase